MERQSKVKKHAKKESRSFFPTMDFFMLRTPFGLFSRIACGLMELLQIIKQSYPDTEDSRIESFLFHIHKYEIT
ncbi:hypothetical protein GPJ61_14900 [Brevibacillus formosus]|uniref:hypothetical protein n=1 Tax=Brevibacillus formosus TaxID=54913 RepID=UPI001CA5B1BC|nr:hypothetical protein [Brevibacillus formosus]MBW5469149.1 hypothetical protein [Brevibacillus formosus]